MRQTIVAGNWKMNHGPRETRRFFEAFRLPEPAAETTVLIFPPAISFEAAKRALEETGTPSRSVALGVQNVHWEAAGAFTGETSAEQAAEAGASHALVGHSERRHVFGETHEETARKSAAVLRSGMTPVLCVGETLEERRAGRLANVLHRQLDAVLGPTALRERIADGAPFVLAYEPVWAIGTGETASPEDAADAHRILREHLRERLGGERADGVSILYGGSVTADNAAALLAAEDVDGVLVGGASLDPTSFAAIASAVGAPIG